MKRRDLLKLSAATLSSLSFPLAAQNIITNSQANKKKLVWVVLRGGMDGLHATLPLFDNNLMALRKDLVAPVKNKALKLKRGFALHPELKFMHQLFTDKQLNAVVATATPYRARSHFDGQDVLESGFEKADVDNGWLARALTEINLSNTQASNQGLAIAHSLPVSMRGGDNAMTWYPSNLSSNNDDLLNRIMQLYAYDEQLSSRLEQALETQELISTMEQSKKHGKLFDLASSCATLMRDPSGPNIAMLEVNGWDTHSNQVKRMAKSFKELDGAIKALYDGLGDQWSDTLLVIATEFGRTAKSNGTSGSDHGTATSLFIAGGSLDGGKVLGEWPGLGQKDLHQNRDLKPTSNMFSWIADEIGSHWNLNNQQIDRIFPNTRFKKSKSQPSAIMDVVI